jgi:hypothetical protein
MSNNQTNGILVSSVKSTLIGALRISAISLVWALKFTALFLAKCAEVIEKITIKTS